MSLAHDIYNPPPSQTSWLPPEPEPIAFTRSDLGVLLGLSAAWAVITIPAWLFEPMLGMLALVGGALVLLESWFTALGFLHRRPQERPSRRALIMVAALVPWLIGLGLAAFLMWALFALSDASLTV